MEISEVVVIGLVTTTSLIVCYATLYLLNRRFGRILEHYDILKHQSHKVKSASSHQIAGIREIQLLLEKHGGLLEQLVKSHKPKAKPTIAQKLVTSPLGSPGISDGILNILQQLGNDARFSDVVNKCQEQKLCSKPTVAKVLKRLVADGKINKNGAIYSV